MIRVSLDRYPGMNRLVLDWMSGQERFLRRPGLPDVRPRGVTRSAALAAALDHSNRHWGIFAGEELARWQRGETLTIVAGQQVGFAGGPLYTLAKIASLVRLKRDFAARGIPVTLFFWLATEDHDFEEIATLNVPVATLAAAKDVNRQLDLVSMRAIRPARGRQIVGSLAVPETLISQLLALFEIPRPAWLREGISFRDSFAELIASIFGSELILVDALLPELRRCGAPLFDQIRARHDEFQTALAGRAAEMEAAGYREQVIPPDGNEYTLLFELREDGTREPSISSAAAENTSTSALTRPLLQDFVLQPDIFVGGPAEVAYYAQIAPLHELLGIAMPRVALRGHALVLPKRLGRAFARYGIDPAAVFAPADAILAVREPEGVARLRSLADDARRDLFARIEEIGQLALPADHSLAGSIERSVGHLEFHFDKLVERATKGLVRKDRQRYAAVRELVATLYPDRHVQDRVVSWFAWSCAGGESLVERIIEEIEPDAPFFRIVEL